MSGDVRCMGMCGGVWGCVEVYEWGWEVCGV